MTNILTQRNYKPGMGRQKPQMPSRTIPGETYTIQELLDRAMAGHPMKQHNYPYLDSEDIEKIDRYFAPGSLDLTDLQALQERTAELEGIVERAIANREKAEKEEQEARQPPEEPREANDELTEED